MNRGGRRLLFDLPSCYRIRVDGPLSIHGTDRLQEMTIMVRHATSRRQVTTLTCEVRDQAALRGVLDLLYEMGLPVLKVERLRPLPSVMDPNRLGETI